MGRSEDSAPPQTISPAPSAPSSCVAWGPTRQKRGSAPTDGPVAATGPSRRTGPSTAPQRRASDVEQNARAARAEVAARREALRRRRVGRRPAPLGHDQGRDRRRGGARGPRGDALQRVRVVVQLREDGFRPPRRRLCPRGRHDVACAHVVGVPPPRALDGVCRILPVPHARRLGLAAAQVRDGRALAEPLQPPLGQVHAPGPLQDQHRPSLPLLEDGLLVPLAVQLLLLPARAAGRLTDSRGRDTRYTDDIQRAHGGGGGSHPPPRRRRWC